MNILLTGATGFLGSHLLNALLKNEHRPIILKRKSSKLKILPSAGQKLRVCDIEENLLEDIFKNESIDAVIHAATIYGRKGETVAELFQCNVLLPVQLMTLSVKYGVKCFINTDTFYVKNRRIYPSLWEYSISKIQCLQWLRKMAGTKTKVLNVRLEHLYGPGDNAYKFIPNMISKMVADEPGTIELTSGIQKRDFVYIDDMVDAYMILLGNIGRLPKSFLEIEVGTGKTHSIRELVLTIRNLVSPKKVKCAFGAKPMLKGEILSSRAESKLLREMGWMPRYSLRQGLTKLLVSVRQQRTHS